jgi:hypothetical protein
MRKALRWLLPLTVLAGTVGAGGASAGAATDGGTDIKDRILAIPGMSLVEEKPVDGYRFFVLEYEQPVDHRRPRAGEFQQRITLLHKGEDRPTVFFTSGYGLSTEPRRSEPTQIVDGNQVSMEYRFFSPSRPEPADWTKLDIWQAASDQHRIHEALDGIYGRKWLSTGGSKGGMTATYYRRHYPGDMDGTVAYVAPNNVDDKRDAAYDEFLAQVGTADCRAKLHAVQREALIRRDEFTERYAAWAGKEGQTFELTGSVDRAFEVVVLDMEWAFWQYQLAENCATVPAADATTDELYTFLDEVVGFSSYTDQGIEGYVPYYYQAGTQLGQPDTVSAHLKDLVRYPGINTPRTFVPREIPMRFEKNAMKDIDRWVRTRSSEMLYVYGENDPWRAEPFRVNKRDGDSHVFTAPGQNHGADIVHLPEDERATATRAVLEWAGVEGERRAAATGRLTEPDAQLDRPEERRGLRP